MWTLNQLQLTEVYIYNLQKDYKKRYKKAVNDDLHIQKLYLTKLLKELKKAFNKSDLEFIKHWLKIFNEWHQYYLTEWFFNLLTTN